MDQAAVDALITLLDLEPIEVNLFRGNSPKTRWQRVFGGQVIGQAMVAACRTVEGRLPHSLHCYFILPGDPQIPIIYEVERLRDGHGYGGGYTVVKDHVRRERGRGREVFVPLAHPPGHAQVDFGEAVAQGADQRRPHPLVDRVETEGGSDGDVLDHLDRRRQ